MQIYDESFSCELCPRKCGVNRIDKLGACKSGLFPRIAKYQLHMWEEPPISGKRGSGTIFFSGCNLNCVFCQNYMISQTNSGKAVSPEKLAEIFLELQGLGAHNVNLVTPTHFINVICEAIIVAKKSGLHIPMLYNTSSYESMEAISALNGLIDVFLPDIKYFDDEYAIKYSNAPRYFETASKAILEMHEQVGENVFSSDGIMQKGMIIRHLVIPGLRKDSFKVLDWIAQNLPKETYVSLLAQYFPQHNANKFPEINRRITSFEYDSVVRHFHELGLINGFTQQRESAVKEYVPEF